MRLSKQMLCSGATITKEYLNHYLSCADTFDGVLKNLKIVSLGDGKCKAELKVEEPLANILGTLHGGATATIVDCVSSYGLSSLKDTMSHASVNLNLRYLKGAKVGTTVVIETQTVRRGRTLAFLEATLTDKETGAILAKGEHTKFIFDNN